MVEHLSFTTVCLGDYDHGLLLRDYVRDQHHRHSRRHLRGWVSGTGCTLLKELGVKKTLVADTKV